MAKKHRKRMNDGGHSGLKQDKFRNSEFENEDWRETPVQGASSVKTVNTMGGPYEENRGRRYADERYARYDIPFVEGKLHNWNHKRGWDRFYDQTYDRDANRSHGGALIGHDIAHIGKGPKGYARADERIYEDVCEILTLSGDVDATNIEVEVKQGCVYLKGLVKDRNTKRMAELEIENISGVRDVQNMLTFGADRENELRGMEEESREDRLHH